MTAGSEAIPTSPGYRAAIPVFPSGSDWPFIGPGTAKLNAININSIADRFRMSGLIEPLSSNSNLRFQM
jgi:hypothetical protein